MKFPEGAKLNLLAAYPYVNQPLIEELKKGGDNLRFLLDSGAFTAWKAGKPIKLDDYCRFIESLPIRPWRYFTLDVIGDAEASMRNYEIMLERGFKPLPIFTRGENLSALDQYYKTSDVVGIGGLVGTRGNKGFINGVMKAVGDRRVHWLGFTSLEYLKKYRPYMCDSSSWAGALRFGQIKLYKGLGAFVTLEKSDFINKPAPEVMALLNQYEISAIELADSKNWKNSGVGNYPTEKAAFRSFVRYQLDIGKNLGTLMFMAVASNWQARLALDAFNFWRDKCAKQ